MQHCMTTVWKKQKSAMIGSTETCFDAIKVLDSVRKSSDDDLLDRMALGCTGMPSARRAVCKDLMMNDREEVHQMLSSDLPSTRVASVLGLCGGSETPLPHPMGVKGKLSGDYCTDCTKFFGDIREIFMKSKGEFESLVKNSLCTRVGPLEQLCDSLVDQYAGMAFDIVYQQLSVCFWQNPQDLCYLLQLCSNQSRADLMRKLMMAKNQKGEFCDICMKAAKDVQNALRDPTLQKDIMTALEDEVCPMLGALSTECKTYVAEYAPMVFQIVVAELDPKTICQTFGVCSAAKAQQKLTAVPLGHTLGTVHIIPAQPQTKLAASPQCVLCEFVLTELEHKLTTHETKAEIEAALKEVCSLMPTSIEKECNAFVMQYGDLVINLILQEIQPKMVCTTLGLCESKAVVEKVQAPLKNGELCLVCETVMGYIKAALNDKSTEEEIDTLLKEVCDKSGVVPASYKGLCDQLVDQYTPSIINLISQYDDPVKVCSGLGLCSAAISNESKTPSPSLKFQPMVELVAAKPHLLGSEMCTRGPSYWCANANNARECNAVEHCVKHYNLKMDTNA